MPKVRLQKELENIKRESEAAFQIREEFVRWDNVKTAHDLHDDMEVARMLLDCYDLVGGNFLVWSDQSKLAPPPLYATLRLQHVSPEGWEVLQEIKALSAWGQDKAKTSQSRKSRRKQAQVRHIEQVEIKKEIDPEDGEDRDSRDEDYMPDDVSDDDEFVPEDITELPKRVTKGAKKTRSARGRKPTKKMLEAQELEDDLESDDDDGEEAPAQASPKKRGRPKKGEVRPPPPPKKPKKKKPKPAAESRLKEKVFERRTRKIYECNKCQVLCENIVEFRQHFRLMHMDSKKVRKSKNAGEVKSNESKAKIETDGAKDEIKSNESEAKVGTDSATDEIEIKFGQETKNEDETNNEDEEKKEEEGTKEVREWKYGIDVSTNATIMYRCIPCDVLLKETEVEFHRKRDEDRICTVCDTCGVMFTSRKAWKQHMAKHAAERSGNRFICKICNRSFIFLKQLKKHMKLHSKIRPHICEVCGRSFKQKNALYRHRFVHSAVKPFTCEFCGKGFSDRYNLKGHLRTHTGEKPFNCDVCNSVFTHNVSLKTHKRSAHGIDMWQVQKPQTVQEFDDFNVEDPNAYQKGKVENKAEKTDNTLVNLKKETVGTSAVTSSESHVQQVAQHFGASSNKDSNCPPANLPPKGLPTLNPKRISTPNVPHHSMPPLPIPQGYMQYSEVRQFIPLMINPFEFAGASEMDRGMNEAAPGKSFTSL